MAYRGLQDFIRHLERESELIRIKTYVDPVLEITEITDRITKNNGKALLFENNGTKFPLLINAFGSDSRLRIALSIKSLDRISEELTELFEKLTGMPGSFTGKLKNIPKLIHLAGIMPSRTRRKGKCQEIIESDPDVSILPVLKCWPFDGGRFITLPMVHTIHPTTGRINLGMYRMQILDNKTTAMHWQRHKTGANHFEAWKKTGKRMPVTVTLGGDPVYTYAATAPLPENIDEYILAGFLRKKGVKLVKCITNDLYVPEDADIVLEGYVDPSEELFWEGPFGDHTGFYSLADWYPRFHITCITHSKEAVYPATIVGIPPQEDAWLAKATERIFLAPVRLALQPEIIDFHMPDAGVAHNLAIIRINKSYPGQGKKVLSSLMGAGQMMFTKYMIAVSGETDIRNYKALSVHILENTHFRRDMVFTKGPLDVLDHSSDSFSYGGKAGIDASIKMPEEKEVGLTSNSRQEVSSGPASGPDMNDLVAEGFNIWQIPGLPVLVAGVNQEDDSGSLGKLIEKLKDRTDFGYFRIILAVDFYMPAGDNFFAAWQILGNSDPVRDTHFINDNTILIDGTLKAFRKRGFPRNWPNIVCSSTETILKIDQDWDKFGLGSFIESPSQVLKSLYSLSNNEIITPGTRG